MDNTENVVAQMKQIVTVFQAAIAAIEGTYVAKVAVIVDQQIKDKDAEIVDLQEQLAEAKTSSVIVEPTNTPAEVI